LLSYWEILGLAFALSMDAFSVSMAVAAGPRLPRQTFRLSFHFGLFQFFMPLIGGFLGGALVDLVGAWDHWIALALLVVVGGRMVRGGLDPHREDAPRRDPSTGWSLIALSVATSIDALAVGFGLGLLAVPLWIPCLTIGLITAALSLVAIRMGRVLGERFGPRMEIVGGVILMVIGLNIVVSHLQA